MNADEQRKHLRFYPDKMEVAMLDMKESSFDAFRKSSPDMTTDFVALIENESHTGASLVMIAKEANPPYMSAGRKCIVKLGPLEPMRAEIKWVEWLNGLIARFGITLLD